MEQGDIDLRSILGLLRRQSRLIILCIILITGGAGIYVLSLTQIYSASALILVDPRTKNLLTADDGAISTSGDNARIDSEVEILRSDHILLKVIQAEGLLTDGSMGVTLSLGDRILTFLRLTEPTLPTAEMALNQAMSRLRSSLSIQRRGATYLLTVQASSPIPAEAARLANAVANVYVQDQLASKVTGVLAARDILQSRSDLARSSLVASEGSFDSFVADNMERIAADSGRSDLAQMQQRISQLQQSRQQAASMLTSVRASLAAENWQSLVSELQSAALNELETQRTTLLTQVAARESGGADSVDLRSELDRIEAEMLAQSNAELTSLRSTVTEQQSQEEKLRQEMRNEVISSNLSPDTLAQLYELQQTTALARNQYQLLLTRSQELDTQATLQVADSRIVSPALQPQSPAFPNHRLILLLAALAGVGIGFGVAFLNENFIGGFTSEEQASSVLKVPVSTAVPRVKNPSSKSVSDLVVTSPLSIYAESIRRIRSTTDQMLRHVRIPGEPHSPAERRGKVIMVTSSTPNEGKTTISLALARSYALAGYSVALLDCDLRKPAVHRHLGLERSEGLYEFLSDGGSEHTQLNAITSQDPLTDATVIVGARHSNTPTDQLLSGTAFPRLVEAARKVFDIIILDTSPLGPVVDGLYLAPQADVIVFVALWANTSQSEAKQSLARLEGATNPDTKIFAVLNQQDKPNSRYMRKYSGYYQSVE